KLQTNPIHQTRKDESAGSSAFARLRRDRPIQLHPIIAAVASAVPSGFALEMTALGQRTLQWRILKRGKWNKDLPAFLLSLEIRIPRYAAVKWTTFFLPRVMMFVGGTKVTSTYFLAQATKSRLQLRSSLCLMFSRWLSMVLTLRFSDCAIWVFPRPEPNKKKMCVSRSDNFSMPIVGRVERCCCSDRVSSDFLKARIATSWLT